MLNALGNEIKIGDSVGYVQRQSGHTSAFVGTVKGFTKDRVSIDVVARAQATYEAPLTLTGIGRKTSSAFGSSLYPVNLDDLNWKEK